MRDDFTIPNLGEGPDDYNKGYINRLVRNIEMMMRALKSKGPISATTVDADTVTADSLTIDGLGNGLVAHTGSGAYAARTITGTANKITVTNGDGVSGNPTITIPDAVTLVSPTVTGRLDFQTNAVIRMTTAGGDFVVENSTGQDLVFVDDDWASFYYGDGTYRGGFAFDGFEINANKTLRFGFGADYDELWHDDTTNTWYVTSDGAATRETTNTNATLNVGRVRLTNAGDASLSSTDHPFQIGDSSGQNIIGDANELMSRNNGATSDLHINADGGDVRINANDGSGGLTLRGGQIAFPAGQNASSNANTLDDYEEGTWTPTLLFGGASTGIAYITQTGSYVKVGQNVAAWFRINLSSKGSATGGATITGWPFSASVNTSAVFGTFYNNMASMSGLLASLSATTATLRTNGAASAAGINDTNFNNNSDLIMCAIYKSAS